MIIAAAAMFAAVTEASAQKKYRGGIEFGEPVFTRTAEGVLEVGVTADLGKLDLKRQQAVILTPVLMAETDGEGYLHDFEPVAIGGTTRYKAMNREIKLGNSKFDRELPTIIKRKNKKQQAYDFSFSVPYEAWMDSAELVFIEEVSGCAGCKIARNELAVGPVVPEAKPIYIPVETVVERGSAPHFKLSLIIPPADTLKQRAETYSAWLNYEQGRSVLRRDIGRNNQMLMEVDRIIYRLQNDPNVNTITISVKGYASPEGDAASNLKLSRNRARAFMSYLRENHGFAEDMINFAGYGEDWIGLRAMVEKSGMNDRQAVLNIIDFTPSVTERKNKIKALSGGSTYRYMLSNIYPTLRRNEYTISYTVKPFDIEEAKKMVKTDPAKMSLYEMYQVAASYEKTSYEFREVFDTAARVYPTDPIANVNASALDIIIEADDVAISRIYTIAKPEAWNNLAIAYFKKGMYDLAEEYFLKALTAGEENAIYNYSQFRQWKDGGRGQKMDIQPGN